jgi:FKBP-type peptidyl-prolyl cis-trans isomerase (trigger factor)
MKYTTARLADNSIELSITLPWVEIEKVYEEVIVDFVKNAEISGFRKGKAPRDIVEKSLDKGKVYEEVVRRIIPKAYSEALVAEKLHPIVMPKIELKEAVEKKDWIIKAITAEKPLFELGEYKKAITDLASAKAKKLWVPGQDASAGSEKGKEEMEKKPTLDEILMTLFGTVKATIPEILIENETNRLLSDLIDQTKKLGMSVEQYLGSTHKTSESIREEYKEQAIRTITLEFALEEIADKEGLLISDDEIQKAVDTAKTPEEKKALESEKYYLATILRRQKTLDFLAAL